MKIKCRYCDSYISDTDERCPSCGAVNDNLKRVGNGVPTTIKELKEWYIEHNLPEENITRFFIGKDYQEPKAFGIFYDEVTGNYVVYKNKDNGTRVIRYEGKDEKYAVNELYLKLKEEILNQKNSNSNKKIQIRTYTKKNNEAFGVLFFIHFIAVFIAFFTITFNPFPAIFLFLSLNPGIFIILPILNKIKSKKTAKIVENSWHIISFIIFFILLFTPGFTTMYDHRKDAYYTNDETIYYNYGNDWYYYTSGNWYNYYGNTSSFDYLGDNYSTDYNVDDFKETEYYENFWDSLKTYDWPTSESSSSNSWDSSSSWDSSDSWDSDSTDWSSDW